MRDSMKVSNIHLYEVAYEVAFSIGTEIGDLE